MFSIRDHEHLKGKIDKWLTEQLVEREHSEFHVLDRFFEGEIHPYENIKIIIINNINS
jgi:hypothetical protein